MASVQIIYRSADPLGQKAAEETLLHTITHTTRPQCTPPPSHQQQPQGSSNRLTISALAYANTLTTGSPATELKAPVLKACTYFEHAPFSFYLLLDNPLTRNYFAKAGRYSKA